MEKSMRPTRIIFTDADGRNYSVPLDYKNMKICDDDKIVTGDQVRCLKNDEHAVSGRDYIVEDIVGDQILIQCYTNMLPSQWNKWCNKHNFVKNPLEDNEDTELNEVSAPSIEAAEKIVEEQTIPPTFPSVEPVVSLPTATQIHHTPEAGMIYDQVSGSFRLIK
jgi:hypothetical protein